jgi:hypothetical protein
VKNSRAWENVRLSVIADEIARRNSMKCMFLAGSDRSYTRREQTQVSDIVFLQRLCYNAGITLKVTNNILVLFDESEYEKKSEIATIRRGKSDVLSYRFSTTTSDTKYSSARVSYTDPTTGFTIDYTYTPRDSDPQDPILEINEKVNDREDARRLAMRRYRQRSKNEFQASFTLVDDVRLVSGVTVNIVGWGFFDGKYIIETSTRNITASGGTLQIKLHRAAEN